MRPFDLQKRPLVLLYPNQNLRFLYFKPSLPSSTFHFPSTSLFCLIRMASFIIRAILAGSAGNDVNLIIGDQVLFSIGFFGLLYSAYTLVLDRELVSDYTPSAGIVSRIIRRRRLYRLTLLVAVVIGSVGISEANTNDPSAVSVGQGLHQASTIIFLVLVVLLAYQTLILAKAELRGGGYKHAKGSFGAKFGIYVLLVIALLLVVREVFAVATTNDLATANKEHFWYPFVALPEILAVMLYSIPDLVPMRSELPKSRFC
ncbi:hypothetical protein D9615_002115 [Tricholomella constricta]|uniref:DUF7702 domain-containing protein n=1 Tax=Tricholomella constricta TaxID=117010 RepID=A0A8H5HP56_9AGAR|nr:hypothetical protein D9615_002115 [Tricholomella constricta]